MSANAGIWGVIIADIVGSSEIPALRQVRDETLARLSQQHLRDHRVLARYTVTAWDEFQNVLTNPWEIPRVVWDLRVAFSPTELRIGIGLGAIQELPDASTPINEVSSGEAFLRAREAVSAIDRETRKYVLRTVLRCGDPELDRTINLVYMLTDSLLSNLSDRQWESIRAYEETGRLDEAAARLHLKSVSTVSRSLQRAFYWQLQDAHLELRDLLQARLHTEVQNLTNAR